MVNIEGMEIKFTVFKNEDIEKYLPMEMYEELDAIESCIMRGRLHEGRSINTYLVINTDEPYADQVIDILKANGHWG